MKTVTILLSIVAFSNVKLNEKTMKDVRDENKKVQRLFDTMRAGEYKQVGDRFPDLTWVDVPALLEMGASKRVLKTFPYNKASSIRQTECAEGIVALWLVEGFDGEEDFRR